MSSARPVVTRRMTALLEGRIAIIYGAGGSLGSATAKAFAREGATVHLVGRAREPLEALHRYLAAELGPRGTRVVGIHTAGVHGTLSAEKIAEAAGIDPSMMDVDAIDAGIAQATMLKRTPTISQIAETATFLACDRAGAITSGIVNATCGLVAG